MSDKIARCIQFLAGQVKTKSARADKNISTKLTSWTCLLWSFKCPGIHNSHACLLIDILRDWAIDHCPILTQRQPVDTSIDYKNSTKTIPRPNTLEIPRLILWMSPKPDLRHKPLDKDKKIRYQGLGVVSCGSLWWKKNENKTNEKSKVVLPSVRAESWGCEGRSPTSERFSCCWNVESTIMWLRKYRLH